MNEYQENLRKKMDEFAHFIYRITSKFPKQEMFGIISQFRRAGLSVILNYIEGYARMKPLVRLNFLEISFGSFKESRYLFDFSYSEKLITKEEYDYGIKLGDEIGAMLWKEIQNLSAAVKN
ncbi:MAG: four helix bundle protein [Patescibacteria group bacterium]